MDVVRKIEDVSKDASDKPDVDVVIEDSGVMPRSCCWNGRCSKD